MGKGESEASYLPILLTWVNYLMSVKFSSMVCKMALTTVLISEVVVEIERTLNYLGHLAKCLTVGICEYEILHICFDV